MIKKAEQNDIEAVAASYLELFAYEAVHGNNTNWVPGLYPSKNTAQTAFAKGSLYVLQEGSSFCGSMILNQIQPVEYKAIDWCWQADTTEIFVLHTLCIPPSKKERGMAESLSNMLCNMLQNKAVKQYA